MTFYNWLILFSIIFSSCLPGWVFEKRLTSERVRVRKPSRKKRFFSSKCTHMDTWQTFSFFWATGKLLNWPENPADYGITSICFPVLSRVVWLPWDSPIFMFTKKTGEIKSEGHIITWLGLAALFLFAQNCLFGCIPWPHHEKIALLKHCSF